MSKIGKGLSLLKEQASDLEAKDLPAQQWSFLNLRVARFHNLSIEGNHHV